MLFDQPPGGDGNDPNNPNNYPTTPTSDRGSSKTPGAPRKRDRFTNALRNDDNLQAILEEIGDVNPGVFEDIRRAAQRSASERGLIGDHPTQSASPSGFGFGIGKDEKPKLTRVASDPGIDSLSQRPRGMFVTDDSGYYTPVSSPSSSRSGSPPGAPRKENKYPRSKGGMSRKSKKSRRFKKSRKPKKSKKTKKSKKNRKSRKHK